MIWVKYPQPIALNPKIPTLPYPKLIMVSSALVRTSGELGEEAEGIRNI